MKRETTRTTAPLGGIGPGGKSPRDYLRERDLQAEARRTALAFRGLEAARCACDPR